MEECVHVCVAGFVLCLCLATGSSSIRLCVSLLRQQQHIISENTELLVYSAVIDHSNGSFDGHLCFVLAHKHKIKTCLQFLASLSTQATRQMSISKYMLLHRLSSTQLQTHKPWDGLGAGPKAVSHMSTALCMSLFRDSIHCQVALLPCLQATVHEGPSQSEHADECHSLWFCKHCVHLVHAHIRPRVKLKFIIKIEFILLK